jgi:Mn-containing catalase
MLSAFSCFIIHFSSFIQGADPGRYEPTPEGRWTSGKALDGRGEFSKMDKPKPLGQKPDLGKAKKDSGVQSAQT